MRRLEHKKETQKWHLRYLQLAELVATWSKHPQFQVGAVAVGDYGQILSTGYNGWPRGVVDEEVGREKTNARGFSYSIHAEANLIYNTNLIGTSLRGSTVYVHPVFPCMECAKALVQVGVSQICFRELDPCSNGWTPVMWNQWKASMSRAENLFKETGVVITRIHD